MKNGLTPDYKARYKKTIYNLTYKDLYPSVSLFCNKGSPPCILQNCAQGERAFRRYRADSISDRHSACSQRHSICSDCSLVTSDCNLVTSDCNLVTSDCSLVTSDITWLAESHLRWDGIQSVCQRLPLD